MYGRWHRFSFGFTPFGFWFRGASYFPHYKLIKDYYGEN